MVIIFSGTSLSKRCFSCSGYLSDDEIIHTQTTWHKPISCCSFCYHEYHIQCPRCNSIYMPYWGKDMYISICQHCEQPTSEALAEAERLFEAEKKERRKVSLHACRAKRLGLHASLTYKQWHTTLQDFGYKCAYCLSAPYEEMDHFVPLCKGLEGTWQFNCVPACRKCNRAKGQRLPEECRNIGIPFENIFHINQYLNEKWQLWLKRQEIANGNITV